MRRYQIYSGLFLLVALSPVVVGEDNSFVELREAMFEEVWGRVEQTYFDPEFGGKDWKSIGDRYRARLEETRNEAAVERVLRSMLLEIGDSHFGILSPSAKRYTQNESWRGGDVGMELALVDAAAIAVRVESDGAAWEAGVRDGDRLLAVDGQDVDAISRGIRDSGMPSYQWEVTLLQTVGAQLLGEPASRRRLEVAKPDGERRELQLTLKPYEGRISPRFAMFGPTPIEVETERLEAGIAYLRFSIWMPAVMADIRSFVSNLGEETSGLIVDLRGNPGGVGLMAGGLAGLLVDEQLVLATTRLREGHINFVAYPQSEAFLGPVAVLVDRASCSTSEIFALGLQEAGRARVFGEPTPGIALASLFTELPNGAVMQSVMGDLVTPAGTRLERRGVTPDEPVSLSPIALAEGRDTVLESAKRWIFERNGKKRL